MLQNAYFLAKIGADTAENEQHSAEISPTDALWRGPWVLLEVDLKEQQEGDDALRGDPAFRDLEELPSEDASFSLFIDTSISFTKTGADTAGRLSGLLVRQRIFAESSEVLM